MKNDRHIRQQLEQVKVAGKSVVYADESGFRDGYRRYYAPLGTPVFDLISSQRTRTTTLNVLKYLHGRI